MLTVYMETCVSGRGEHGSSYLCGGERACHGSWPHKNVNSRNARGEFTTSGNYLVGSIVLTQGTEVSLFTRGLARCFFIACLPLLCLQLNKGIAVDNLHHLGDGLWKMPVLF